MTLNEYFENKEGMGVLATANREGLVNAAIYARPHVIDEANIALIMSDRLSHLNLQSNPRALIPEIRRRKYPEVEGKYAEESKFLVFFHVDRILPLIGEK